MRTFLNCIAATAFLFYCGAGVGASPSTAPAESPAIHPPQLAAKVVTLKLEGAVTKVIPAAGGRYLLVQMNAVRQLAVFDVNEAKIIHTVPLPSDKSIVAGGKTKFVIGDPDLKTLERWNLFTLRPELKGDVPKAGLAGSGEENIHSLAMGYATDGPLLVHGRVLVDLDFKTLPVQIGFSGGAPYPVEDRYPYRVDASANGKTFGGTQEGGLSPSGIDVLRLDGPKPQWLHEHASARAVLPTYDGSLVCAGDVIIPVLKDFRKFDRVPDLIASPGDYIFVPAYSPDFLLRVSPIGLDCDAVYIRDPKKTPLPIPKPSAMQDISKGFEYPRRVHYIPDAQLFVGVNDTMNELSLVHFDVFAAMKKAKIKYEPAPAPDPAAAKGR